MRKVLSGLILFFVCCGAAFADSNWVTGSIMPVSQHTDVSIAFLAQVFGTVGSSLQGTSGQMLGMLFSKLNEGILVVAGIWLIYTVVTIVLRSAMDGSFMGPNKNTFWIIIRIALAFAMLIPGPMTGYNVIQDITMKIVVEGVSLADQTWNFGLDYITAGGSLWHAPEATQGFGSKGKFGFGGAVATQAQGKKMLSPASQIFLNEVCMVKSSTINQSQDQNSNSGGVANTSSSPIQYNIVANDTTHTFYFPGVGNSGNYSSTLNSAHPGTAYCGSVAWNSHALHANCSSSNSMSCMLGKAAVSQMVYDMLPAAQRYVCSTGDGGNACIGLSTSGPELNDDIGQSFFNSLVNYINAVMPLAQKQNEGGARTMERFIPDAEKEGWMMAGRYYWDLAQIQGYELDIGNIAKYVPSVQTSHDAHQGNAHVKTAITNAKSQVPIYTNKALANLANYGHASGAGNTGAQYPSIARTGGNWVLGLMLSPVVGDITSLFALFSVHAGPLGMGPDPIMFLHNVGMKCIAIAGDIWLGLGLLIFAASLGTMVCQSTLNLDTPLEAISNWIKPLLMVLASALLGVGVLLGYYVPLYPFMLFTFGVIGWIICVIEAMVAAPLIAFGLTHPEGHDFLGEAKQGLMLLLGVFLRPVLMVIGLIAGMILSYVSLRILVYTYSGFLQDLFFQTVPTVGGSTGSVIAGAAKATISLGISQSSGPAGLMMSLFCFPLMLAIFAMLVYVVTNQCFSLIYVLPDYILRWIGGPQTNTGMNPAQMAGEVKGAMGSMASTASSGMSQGLGAADKGVQDANAQKQSDDTTQHGLESGDGPPEGGAAGAAAV